MFQRKQVQSIKNPTVLVSEALQTFTLAQQQIDAAKSAIQEQINIDQEKIEKAQARIEHATSEKGKLERIASKISDLLS